MSWLKTLTSRLNVGFSRQRAPRSLRRQLRVSLRAERLEDRLLLATNITWINETDPLNNFALFGSDADTARGVVAAAIETWERTVTGFNGQDLDIPLTIYVDPNNGGTYAVGVGQYDPMNNNIPVAGTVTINRGLGDTGWFFDETPLDNSEFQGTLVNAFARQSTAGVLDDTVDFYTLLVHEIGHIMGITSDSPLLHENPAVSVTKTTIPDGSSPASDDFYWIFQGNSANVLMTDFNLPVDGGGTTEHAVHNARPVGDDDNMGIVYWLPNVVYGSVDTMIGTSSIPVPRILLSNKVAMMLDDMGYDVVMPERFGTMNTILNESTGVLTIDGGRDDVLINGLSQGPSNDMITISRNATQMIVTIDFGVDVPGTGPGMHVLDQQGDFVSRFDIADVSSIVVLGYGGNDEIRVSQLPQGIDLTIQSGPGDDVIRLGGFTIDDINASVNIDGGPGVDLVRISDAFGGSAHDYSFEHDELTIDDAISITFDRVEHFELLAGSGSDTIVVNSLDASQTLDITAGGGSDDITINLGRGFASTVLGTIEVNGGSAGDKLSVDDADSFVAASYTVTDSRVRRAGLPWIDYEQIEELTLRGGLLANDYSITSTSAVTTVRGSNRADSFVVGNFDLDGIHANLIIEGRNNINGEDTVVFRDIAGANFLYGINDNRLFGPGFAGIQLIGIEQATLHANQFNDNQFYIENAPGPTRYTVNGGSGDDSFFLASDAQNLSLFNTPLILNGGLRDDHLFLYDQSAPFNPSYTVTANSVDRIGFGEFSLPPAIGVNFSSMSDVELFMNSANNTVNVASTTADLTLHTAAGNDTIHLGGGVLEALSGLVTVNAGTGTDAIILHDETDTGHDAYSIGNNWVTKPGFALSYNQTESLTLNANPFNNTIDVESTAANAPVTINAGDGGDTISITPVSDNLTSLLSNVIVNGQAGTDNVILNDKNNPIAVLPYTITANSAGRPFAGQVNYATIERLVLQASDLDSSVNVVSTDPSTLVYVYGNRGQDQFNVNVPTRSSVTLDGGLLIDSVILTGTNDSDDISIGTGLGDAQVNLIDVESGTLDALGGTDVLVYQGVAGIEEDIHVHGSATPNAGSLIRPSVLDLIFGNTENIELIGNPGDNDRSRFLGTNLADEFFINLSAQGTQLDPLLQLFSPGAAVASLTLLNNRNFGTLRALGLDGADVFNVNVAPTGPIGGRNLHVDGGFPSGPGNSKDQLNVNYQKKPKPNIKHTLDPQNDSGSIDAVYSGLYSFHIDYVDIEEVQIKGAN